MINYVKVRAEFHKIDSNRILKFHFNVEKRKNNTSLNHSGKMMSKMSYLYSYSELISSNDTN
jgi:hypothetical protein